MIRRIVGWRHVDGEPWDETMCRMRDRIDDVRRFYSWQFWSHRFFRDQWRFAMHASQRMSEWMLVYNCSPILDVSGDFIPHRDAGRPRMKWDDYLKAFFAHKFPARNSEHWFTILRSIDPVRLENEFVDFCL